MTKLLSCSEFKPQSHYNVHFRIINLEKGKNFLIFSTVGKILSFLYAYTDSFGI